MGPYQLLHDHDKGRSTIWRCVDLLELVRASEMVSANDAAGALFDTSKPTAAQREKARRRLEALVRSDHLWVIDKGDQAANRPKMWAAR